MSGFQENSPRQIRSKVDEAHIRQLHDFLELQGESDFSLGPTDLAILTTSLSLTLNCIRAGLMGPTFEV